MIIFWAISASPSHTVYECFMFTKCLIFDVHQLYRKKNIVFVCRGGRALLFCSLNILPFTVTSLPSSALLMISFRDGRMCSFCLGVCACVGACFHVRIPSVDPSVNSEGILKSIAFSQQILLQNC